MNFAKRKAQEYKEKRAKLWEQIKNNDRQLEQFLIDCKQAFGKYRLISVKFKKDL